MVEVLAGKEQRAVCGDFCRKMLSWPCHLISSFMNKRILAFLGLVAALFGAVFLLFFRTVYAEVIFASEDAPYSITLLGDDLVYEFVCEKTACTEKVEIGFYDLVATKEGEYYDSEQSFDVSKGVNPVVHIDFEVIPHLADSEKTEIPNEIFDFCYWDTDECGSILEIETDPETGYRILWEGDIRRATFTKGLDEFSVFDGGLQAVVYDEETSGVYIVKFLADSREFLFDLEGLSGVNFLWTGELLVEAGDIYLWNGESLTKMPFNYGLDQVAYSFVDDKFYFVEDGASFDKEGTVIGSYENGQVYVIVEGIEFEPNDVRLAANENGIYVETDEINVLVF